MASGEPSRKVAINIQKACLNRKDWLWRHRVRSTRDCSGNAVESRAPCLFRFESRSCHDRRNRVHTYFWQFPSTFGRNTSLDRSLVPFFDPEHLARTHGRWAIAA
jgi:hypothetical protein